MGRILQDIYADSAMAMLLGLKGGTCAYFFYGLPRFSVDLDFDLLSDVKDGQAMIYQKIVKILEAYGRVKDRQIKRNTIFALLSYGEADHNVKIEINTGESAANLKERYELKKHLGISLLAAKKDYLFAGKLLALTSRKEEAMRDIYDIHFFAKNNWDINAEVIKTGTGKAVKEYLADCLAFVEKIKAKQILHGLGELLEVKEKSWVKNHLQAETILLLKNYLAALET